MALSHPARKRLAILALVVGMPLYVVAAVSLVARFERPPVGAEFAIYVGLGIVWIVPLRRLFLGVGRPGPDEGRGEG